MQAINLGMHANTQSLHLLGGILCLLVVILLICVFVPYRMHDDGGTGTDTGSENDTGGRARSLPAGMVDIVGARSEVGVSSRVWTTRRGEE